MLNGINIFKLADNPFQIVFRNTIFYGEKIVFLINLNAKLLKAFIVIQETSDAHIKLQTVTPF